MYKLCEHVNLFTVHTSVSLEQKKLVVNSLASITNLGRRTNLPLEQTCLPAISNRSLRNHEK